MKAVFDTNIIIDYLLGNINARNIITKYNNPQISIICKIEVLVGIKDQEEEIIVRDFLSNFNILSLNEEIADLAVSIRKKYRIKLPDAIIWATAKFTNSLLITRNTKDFASDEPDIKVPY